VCPEHMQGEASWTPSRHTLLVLVKAVHMQPCHMSVCKRPELVCDSVAGVQVCLLQGMCRTVCGARPSLQLAQVGPLVQGC
jgi:hypothetical protein